MPEIGWRMRLVAGGAAVFVAGLALWGMMETSTARTEARLRETCADFRTHAEAVAAYRAGNTRLDGDRDGVPCESLR